MIRLPRKLSAWEFGLSKNAFKRAVGHLLKEGKIQIKDRRIYLVK